MLAALSRIEVETNGMNTRLIVKSVIASLGETTELTDDPDREADFEVLKSACQRFSACPIAHYYTDAVPNDFPLIPSKSSIQLLRKVLIDASEFCAIRAVVAKGGQAHDWAIPCKRADTRQLRDRVEAI
jgi:hypothetical protein